MLLVDGLCEEGKFISVVRCWLGVDMLRISVVFCVVIVW